MIWILWTPCALPPVYQVRHAVMEEVQVYEHLFSPTNIDNDSGLKDNNINTNSTNKDCPTKRLDTVDSTTGRIIYTIVTLEIINITLIEEETTGTGHFEHKRQ